jgi:hypothetical protein
MPSYNAVCQFILYFDPGCVRTTDTKGAALRKNSVIPSISGPEPVWLVQGAESGSIRLSSISDVDLECRFINLVERVSIRFESESFGIDWRPDHSDQHRATL